MPRPRNGWDSLTARHYDVLNLLCYEGVTRAEDMAEILGCAPNTARRHVQTMLTRMHLHSRTALVAQFLIMERDKDRGKPPAPVSEAGDP